MAAASALTHIPVASPASCPVFPYEVFAAIIDKSARDTIKTVRRSIPFLGRWSMKPLFSQVSLTINTLDLAASERLHFLAGLPEDWIWDLEIRFQGSDLVDQESVGLLCQMIRGTSLQEICLINASLAIGKALLAAREGVRHQARLDTFYIVMHPPTAGATSLEIQHAGWLEAVLAMSPDQRPRRVNAGWGSLPEVLPVDQMRRLVNAGVVVEPGLPQT